MPVIVVAKEIVGRLHTEGPTVVITETKLDNADNARREDRKTHRARAARFTAETRFPWLAIDATDEG